MPKTGLFLHEEVMLLALRDKQGTVEYGTCYRFALGGAILAELLLEGRLGIDESRKKRPLVDLKSSGRLGAPVIDECLEKVAAAKRRASPQTWVSRFASLKGLRDRVAQRLCNRGILRMDEKKVLLVFTRKIYPEMDPRPERELVGRLEKAIFTDTAQVAPRTVVLVSLADATGLLKVAFDKKKLNPDYSREPRLRARISPHLRPFSGLGPCDVLDSTPQALGPASGHICGNLRALASGPHEQSGLRPARSASNRSSTAM